MVVRKPVSEAAGEEAAAAEDTASGGAPTPAWEPPAAAGEQAPAEPSRPTTAGKATSDWFAPRKPPRAGREGAGETTGQHRVPQQAQTAAAYPPPPGAGAAGQEGQASPFPRQASQQTAERTAALPTVPYADGSGTGNHDPGGYDDGYDTGSHDIGSHDTGSHDLGGYQTGGYDGGHDTGSHDIGGLAGGTGGPGHDPGGFTAPAPGGGAGPFPTGASPEHGGRDDSESQAFPSYRPPAGGPVVPPAPGADTPAGGGPRPSGPTAGPASGDALPLPPRRGTDQQPLTTAPPGQPAGYRPLGVEGKSDTLVNGIPAVPPPGPRVPQQSGGGGKEEDYDFRDDAAPKPRGRSKLVLLAGGLVAAAAAVYGVGLVMDHAQVPKNTTVLGVDIGGKSKQDAVDALDAGLGKRVTAPLTLQIGEEKTRLQPRVAGLGIDTESTVRKVAHRDYNPVSVVGSLFGTERTAEAEFLIDEEKLRASLETLAAAEGSDGREGMVKFVAGEPVGVPGKTGLALDVDRAVQQVRQAYLDRAATGQDRVVTLERTRQEPKVTQAEIDRAIEEFGEPAMSGPVVVQAGGIEVTFSPTGSLSEILTMRAGGDGKLQPHFDLEVLERWYGSSFDGLQVDHGGSVGPITPRDVAATMLPLLKETDPAARVGSMEVVQ
ncbi:peptidoglycan binding domain-containing protein [Streptomyces capparidis]